MIAGQSGKTDIFYAACLGGEEAVLKTVGPKGLARSNRVCSVVTMADLVMQWIVDPPYTGSNPVSHHLFTPFV